MATPPPLDGLDLNLLVTLQVLLSEQNVSRAAVTLGTTQPSASRALATLRRAFDDPLLVRSGRGLELSPFGKTLREPLEHLLGGIARLKQLGDFSPKTSHRAFRLIIPDVIGCGVVPRLAAAINETDGLELEVLGMEGQGSTALMADTTDIVVGAERFEHAEFRSRSAGKPLAMSVLLGKKHPHQGRSISYRTWLKSQHVQLLPQGRPKTASALERQLAARGDSRKVRLRAAYLSGLVEHLEQSSLVATLPTPTAQWLAQRHDLRALRHPLRELERVPLWLSWHARNQHDQGHTWFRNLVAREVSAFLASKPSRVTPST